MRALCTGDNHIGSGAELGRTPGERLAEQEEVWRRSLELAREYDCDVVLHGGDLFHRRRPSPEEVLAALRPLSEHVEAGGCRVVMAIGNHERMGVSDETMPAALAQLEAMYVSHSPEIVGVFGGVTVATLPWIPVSRIVAAEDGGDRDRINERAAELLVATARGLRGQIDGQAVLLCHFSISGSSLPTGLAVDELREPVIELSELEALGFGAVVGSHIHKGQVFGEGTFYVGSPMPLNFGEAGYDHGVFILEPDATHGLLVPRFVPIESRKLETLDFDGEADLATEPPYEIAEALVMDAIVRVRVRLTAEHARRFEAAAFRRAIEDAGAYKAFVQVDVERQERARVEGLSEELSEMEALGLWLTANKINGRVAQALVERTERYLNQGRPLAAHNVKGGNR